MTPSQYIRAQGLPSLVYVANKVGKDPRTIYKWYHDNFALFEAVIDGLEYQQVMEDMEGPEWRAAVRGFYEREHND